MRLTLRTMLAYMDEILEPDDAEDIGKKIEESELAKTVMHRTRDALRRMRLGAPPVHGKGMALDANSVAEYLDNTLPAEQVPDFERICLESEVHLAEVGASHQILTLVLGEPAEVDPNSRERMYHLISEASHGTSQAAGSAAATISPPLEEPPVESGDGAARGSAARRSKPEVPEYLRESGPRKSRALALVAILLLVGGGVAAVMLVPGIREQVAGLWGDESESAQSSSGDKAVGKRGAANDKGDLADAGLEPDASEPAESDAAANQNPGNQGTGEENGSRSSVPPAAGDLTIPRNSPDEDGPPAPDPEMTTDADPNEPPPGEGTEVAGTPKSPEVSADGPIPLESFDPAPAAADDDPIGEALGRYLYKQDVLLRFDRRSDLWRRLPAMASISPGDRLMALPAYRPAISLSSGVTVQPVDASIFEILGMDENGVPTIAVDYGRVMIYTAGKPRNQIRLRIGDRQGLITFGDGESTMALDVRRMSVAGKDPTKEGEPLMIDLFATSGEITWEEVGALVLKAPAHQVLSDSSAEPSRGDLPRWTHGEPLSPSDSRGSAEFEKHVTTDKPVSLALKELLDDRRVEVRSYTTRCAAYLGDFEPFVLALNDPGQKVSWTSQIDTLKAAMIRNPDTARRVLEAFEKHRGADAPELFRMLWGYTPEQLSGGEATRLVEYLNHDSLDFRVLAFNNLREITGKGLNYQPQNPQAKRRKEYLSWKERLKEGKVVPATGSAFAPPPPRAGAPKAGAKPPIEPGPRD